MAGRWMVKEPTSPAIKGAPLHEIADGFIDFADAQMISGCSYGFEMMISGCSKGRRRSVATCPPQHLNCSGPVKRERIFW